MMTGRFAAVLIGACACLQAERKGLAPAEVSEILPLIRLSPGEDPFSDIPWMVDVEAAQRRAAAEGKPLFVFANGGEPLGGT